MTDCLFCSISAGDIPADIVLRTPDYVAFHDINPQAPVHILVIPVEHHQSIAALGAADPELAGGLVAVTEQVARGAGLTDYRLVFNTGADAGQSVFHAHGHVLGGRDLNWPPG
jgi:histidine triad (HIT) family protein